jgi:hypothetical protein
MSDDAENFIKLLQALTVEFEELRQSRHDMGQDKYGPFSFLDRDTAKDIGEEIVDAANYLLYLYIKIRLIELNYKPPADAEEALGIKGFKTRFKEDG